jgi:hypoxanthine phosphoribosyltransferase
MPSIFPCELISWHEVHRLCRRLSILIHQSGFIPDTVVAIGRGGYIPARLVCDYLDIMALTSIKIEHYLSGSEKQREAIIRYPLCIDITNLNVLIIDDVNDSGATLQLAVEHIRSFHPKEVRTAVMHDKQVTRYPVDYFARRIIKWRWIIYPWALHEDINAFIRRLSPPPVDLAETRQKLIDDYGIDLPLQKLREITNRL